MTWVIYLIISGTCWGLSDTLCDIVIGHTDKKKEAKIEDYEMVNNTSKSEEGHKVVEKHTKKEDLTANQTIFLSVVTAYILLVVYFLWIIFTHNSYMDMMDYNSFLFKEKYDSAFWAALLSGTFCYFSYHFMIKAFETSSSTIILPLLQFPSIFVLIGSSLVRVYGGHPALESYWHLLAYAFIFFGGLLPATDGNLDQLFTKKFWKQPFVQFAIFSELNHGTYNMLISSGDTTEMKDNFMFLHMEYFAVTRIFYILTFIVLLLFSKTLQTDVMKLKYAPRNHIMWTVISELLAFCGYFCSALAYQDYYQTGIVSASETSLNQLLNLSFAYVLMKYYGKGKQASTTGIKFKILSALMIMVGLYVSG